MFEVGNENWFWHNLVKHATVTSLLFLAVIFRILERKNSRGFRFFCLLSLFSCPDELGYICRQSAS